MNIGFIYGMPIYPPGMGGSVHGYQLAKGLADRGHRLYSWYYGDDEVPFVHHFRARQLLSFLRKIDVLYVRVSWDPTMYRFRNLRWLRLRRLPVVWELNGLPQENLYYRGRTAVDVQNAADRLRDGASGVTAAIGVTPSVQAFLRDEVGIASSYCVPNGSDPHLFAPDGTAPGPGRALEVVWIGGRSPWHDLDALTRAARTLADRGAHVRFTIYGDPNRMPADLPPNVRCPGKVPYADLGRELARADVGVHLFRPARDGFVIDGSPLKIFDYMSCGLAVVARSQGHVGRVLDRTGAGLATDGTPENLAAALENLEAERSWCHQLGTAGRQAVLDYYNWQRVAAETEEILISAVEGKA
ncbi:MAG: glycosyltransferase family 4 protein [Planctomycetota bacterium]